MAYDVVTVGTATRDVFLESDLFRVFRDPAHLKKIGFKTGEAQCFALGAKVEVKKPVFAVGGGAANSAVTFSRQGLTTAAIVKVGDDPHGSAILGTLQKERVHTFSVRDKKEGTAYSVVLLSPSGERTILTYRGAANDITKNEIPFSKLSASWFYIVPGGISPEVILAVIRHAKAKGSRVAMNPSKAYLELGAKKLKPILEELDVVFLNREEAAYLTRSDFEAEGNIFRKLDSMIDGLAVMTDGPRGVIVSDGKQIYRAGTYPEKRLLDRTGAGDAFGSGFVAALAHRENARVRRTMLNTEKKIAFPADAIRKAIMLGSANATSVVEYVGAEEGILTKSMFERNPRWKTLPVTISRISKTIIHNS